MSSWGANTSDESKPKWLTAEDKEKTFADNRGWVYTHANGLEEVIVAIGELAGADKLAAATISSVKFVTDALTADDTTITVDVTWNEAVTVTGSPQITVANGDESGDANGDYTLTYTGTGSTKNKKRFTATGLTLSATDVLTFGGAGSANVALNSGSLKDTADGTTDAQLVTTAVTAQTVTVAAGA